MPADFTAAVTVPGWEHFSIWGFDGQSDSYFAQLWRNEDDGHAAPTIWLSSADGYGSPMRLAAAIALRLGIDREVVEPHLEGFDLDEWVRTATAFDDGRRQER